MITRSNQVATVKEVSRWLNDKVFIIDNEKVFKDERELAQRINPRRRSKRGDIRVDLCHQRKRRSCNLSQLVWMQATGSPIPKGYEVHHIDEDPKNNDFDNLLCIHSLDHMKIHRESPEKAIPF